MLLRNIVLLKVDVRHEFLQEHSDLVLVKEITEQDRRRRMISTFHQE